MAQLKKNEMSWFDSHNTFSHRLDPYVLGTGDPGILWEMIGILMHELLCREQGHRPEDIMLLPLFSGAG